MTPAGAPETLPTRPVFDTPNILWHFGALVATGAAVTVLGQVDPAARGVWILLASLAFLGAFAVLAAGLLQAGHAVPGGILTASALAFVPVAAAGLERLLGVWRAPAGVGPLQEFEGPDLVLALSIVAGGLVAYRLVRYALVLAPVVVATFVAAQLLLPVAVSNPSPSDHATAVLVVGVGLLVTGVRLDLRGSRRVAFWWHVVGLVTMTIGLAYHAFSHTSFGWVLILVTGVALLSLAAPLHRATWGSFGVIGTFAPLAHFTNAWFGTLGAAFALLAVGIGLVAAGLAIQRAGDSWTGTLARRTRT